MWRDSASGRLCTSRAPRTSLAAQAPKPRPDMDKVLLYMIPRLQKSIVTSLGFSSAAALSSLLRYPGYFLMTADGATP